MTTPATVGLAVNYMPAMPIAPMNWVNPNPLPGVIGVVHGPASVDLSCTDLDGKVHQVVGATYQQVSDPALVGGNFAVPA